MNKPQSMTMPLTLQKLALVALAALALAASRSHAQDAAFHRGQTLHAEKCAACHAEKSGLGNGDVLYTRSDRRVTDTKRLEGMVARCNSELRLDLFPEDESDLVKYLLGRFYSFK